MKDIDLLSFRKNKGQYLFLLVNVYNIKDPRRKSRVYVDDGR